MGEELKTPSREELEKLPRWARVAFAARCARRVQPLFRAYGRDAPEEHLGAVDQAVTLAESAAANAADSLVVAAEALKATHAAGLAADSALAVNPPGASADTLDAAVAALAAADAAEATGYANAANLAAAAAAASAAIAADAGLASVCRAMRRDFELLSGAAAPQEQGGEAWTDDTPVPPAFFGPLWPEGSPKDWPATEETSDECELEFEIDVPEGVSDEELYETAIELADQADDLYRAYGGRGLKVKTVEVFEEAGVREGVLS